MSVWVTTPVWEFSSSQHGARLTLLAIADSADKVTAIAYLKQTTLAEMTLLDERSVREALRWLEDAVEIETRQAVKHRTRINVYRVLLGRYVDVEIDTTDLPFRMLEPFSSPAEIAERKLAAAASTLVDDRKILPVVDRVAGGVTTGRNLRDDRQNQPLPKKDPFLDPGTEEAKNASSVSADAADERARTRLAIELALSAELGVKVGKLTRSERGAWERAITDLVDVDASAADVAARALAYREVWPDMAMTPPALVRHWSMLGARVEIAAGDVSLDRWMAVTMPQLEPEHARDIVDSWPGLSDRTRVDAVEAIDAQHRRAA